MDKYWVMAPAEYATHGKKAARYQQCWQYDLENNVISIGWNLGEAPKSKGHLAWLWEEYADPEWRKTDHGLKMLMKFWFDIQPLDGVIARAGAKKFVGIGTFQEEPYYDCGAYGLTWGCSFRQVLWQDCVEERFAPFRLGRTTLYPISEAQYCQFKLRENKDLSGPPCLLQMRGK